ncbi:hypothetical protein ACXU4B_06155 [Dyella soli]|uniref:Uncharacterized protein n=1 Tax=Dyella soli TaxID=522319 RepID=A0A4R0YUG9_9GAMM|nr:hypothetical protein EZM97_17045 [Dyella soli]
MAKARDAQIKYHSGGSAGFFMPRRGIAEYDPARPLTPLARLVRIHPHDLSTRRKVDGKSWDIRISHVMGSMHISEAQWVRARRELEAHGYYRAERQRHENGKWQWIHHAYEDPQQPGQTIPLD